MRFYIPWLLITFPILSFATQADITYVVKQSKPTTLTLTAELPSNHTSELSLPAQAMGVPSQINNLKCDGEDIQQHTIGIWLLPTSCRQLSWEINLKDSQSVTAAQQQSVIHNKVVILSSASSLPRLKYLTTQLNISLLSTYPQTATIRLQAQTLLLLLF